MKIIWHKKTFIGVLVGVLFFAGVISVGFFCKNIQNTVAKQAFNHASYHFNGGAYNLNKAEQWYKIALAIQPKLANTHYQLARINFVKGDFYNALSEINTELATNPQNVRSYYIKGLIDGYSTNYQAAIADFKKFVEWSPSEWAGYNDLAWAQYKAKDYLAVEETISSALKKVTPNAFLLNGLGVAKLGQKKYDEAKKVFASALQLAQNLTVKDWQNAYPGNDPAEAEKKLEEFKDDLASNSGLASNKLSMGGVFTSACSASTYHQCSGTSCVAYTCDPDHTTCPNTCSNDCNCGATPPAPTNLSASCGGAGTSMTLSWGATSCATIYAVRVNNLANPWSECRPDPLDSCPDTSATSETIAAVPGASYGWWVHGCNGPTNCGPATGGNFTCAATNNAACLGISAPDSVTAGQTFGTSVTMNNNGTKVWNSDGTPHSLGSQNPQDNGIWGLGRVRLPWEPVNPGQSVTFNFNATAPSSPGSYPFAWKMVEDYVEWFGATCQKNINVVSLPPTVSISADSTSIPYNTATTIRWSSTNATSCTVSPPGWTGTSGAQGTGNLTSSQTYTVNCSGPGGSVSGSVTVSVVFLPCSDPSYPSGNWDRVWCNKGLTGKLADAPDQGVLQFNDDWGSGVVAGIRADDIGFKSGRTVNLPQGLYTFTLGSDDGSRLWVDGSLCIDYWGDQGYTERTCQRLLSSGNHNLRIDWYENGGAARASFRYIFVSLPGDFNLNLGGSVVCNSVPLSWTSSSDAQAYKILRGSPRVDISPYQPYTALNHTDTTVSQNITYPYQIEAYNVSGTNRSNTINVSTPYCPPTLNFSTNSTSLFQGQSVTLSWAAYYVTSCTASGAWSGSKSLSGSEVVVPLPPPSVTYTLTCSGPGGSDTKSVTVNIVPLALPDWKEVIPR